MARVFLSYSVADEPRAVEVRRMLVVEGHEVFLDHDPQAGIKPGQEWEAGLHTQLRRADVTVCLLTATYVESRWCFAEIFTAQTLGQLVVPLLLQPGIGHRLLDAVQRIDFTAEDGPARLAARLREVDACGGAGWADELSPFPGLRAFDARWRQAFRGRDHEVRELSARDEPRRLANLTGHTGGLTSVTWSRDLLATTSDDNTVLLWDLTGLDELRRHGIGWACVSAGGGLTKEEWSRYVPTLPYEQTY